MCQVRPLSDLQFNRPRLGFSLEDVPWAIGATLPKGQEPKRQDCPSLLHQRPPEAEEGELGESWRRDLLRAWGLERAEVG